MKASRMIKRWESRLSINYGALALVRSFFTVIVLAHWFACLWGLQSQFRPPKLTWKGKYSYCVLTDSDEYEEWGTDMYVSPSSNFPDYSCVSEGQAYMAALYWSVMTITSIGYGDLTANHMSPEEQAVAVTLMLMGSFAWGNVIATFCGVIATLNPADTEYRHLMDELNRFVQMQGFPVEMRRRLREYFHQTKHLQLAASHKSLLGIMSPTLQGEVALQVDARNPTYCPHCHLHLRLHAQPQCRHRRHSHPDATSCTLAPNFTALCVTPALPVLHDPSAGQCAVAQPRVVSRWGRGCLYGADRALAQCDGLRAWRARRRRVHVHRAPWSRPLLRASRQRRQGESENTIRSAVALFCHACA